MRGRWPTRCPVSRGRSRRSPPHLGPEIDVEAKARSERTLGRDRLIDWDSQLLGDRIAIPTLDLELEHRWVEPVVPRPVGLDRELRLDNRLIARLRRAGHVAELFEKHERRVP